MNKIVKKIKVLLGMVKDEFEKAVLADGSEVSFDALEINREVYDSEGNPLAEGEYTLEDGTKISVDVNGVIKEIEKADGEIEKEEVVEEMADEETTETTETTETVETTEPDKTDEFEARIAGLEQAVNDIYEMVLKIAENQKEAEVKVDETIQEFSKIKSEPQTAPLHFGSEMKKEEEMTAVDKFLKFKHNK